LPLNQRDYLFKGSGDSFSTVDLSYPCITTTIGKDYQVSGKERGMCPTQGEKHAIMPCHRDDLHFGDYWKLTV
jgi:hypothetical protein